MNGQPRRPLPRPERATEALGARRPESDVDAWVARFHPRDRGVRSTRLRTLEFAGYPRPFARVAAAHSRAGSPAPVEHRCAPRLSGTAHRGGSRCCNLRVAISPLRGRPRCRIDWTGDRSGPASGATESAPRPARSSRHGDLSGFHRPHLVPVGRTTSEVRWHTGCPHASYLPTEVLGSPSRRRRRHPGSRPAACSASPGPSHRTDRGPVGRSGPGGGLHWWRRLLPVAESGPAQAATRHL